MGKINDVDTRQVDNCFYIRQNELTQKYIKLKVLQDVLQANDAGIPERKKLLNEETNALDKLHHEVWTLQNQMCEKIWDFSVKHDFNTILNYYPDIPNEFSFNCECKDTTSETSKEDQAETQKILLEIRKLESDYELEGYHGLKEDLIRAKEELKDCEKESSEVQRLKSDIAECKDRIASLEEKNKMKSSSNIYGSINTPNFDEDNASQVSRASSISTTCLDNINLCTLKPPPLKPATQMNNNNFKRKCPESNDKLPNTVIHFVKASNYMKDTENQFQIKNTASNNEPKRKFVFKQKSLITQRLMR